MDIFIIAICAVLCGADTWTDVELFGKSKHAWFKTFLALPHGIPSHDTFGRVFSLLDPKEFEGCFESWVRTIVELAHGDVVAIDGKTVRRSYRGPKGIAPLHLVSAFSVKNGLCLGERSIDTKSNELKAIPKLLKLLDVAGCTVTIDAGGSYPEVVRSILEKEADYVIALKRNQPTLYEDVKKIFEDRGHEDATRQTVVAHGREEIRECRVASDAGALASLRTGTCWKELSSLVEVKSTRTIHGRTSVETRYYISSLIRADAQAMLKVIRSHWMIENALHWILDIAYREDESRIRIGHAAENFALMRKITLNLLKQDMTVKNGIKAKRLKAGWDENYLLHVLGISKG